MSRTGKSIDMEYRLMAAWRWHGGLVGGVGNNYYEVSFRDTENVLKVDYGDWLHNSVNIQKHSTVYVKWMKFTV